jgi:hypothetical protein
MSPSAMVSAVLNKSAPATPKPDARAALHDTVADADEVCERARALVQRGGPFVPAEAAVLGAASEHLLDRPIRDGWDVLVVQTCSRFRPPPPPKPESATPFSARIAETVAELRRLASLEDAAFAEMHRVRGELDQASIRGQETAELLARWRELQEDHRAADAAWLRVKSRLTALQLSADRWRVDQE